MLISASASTLAHNYCFRLCRTSKNLTKYHICWRRVYTVNNVFRFPGIDFSAALLIILTNGNGNLSNYVEHFLLSLLSSQWQGLPVGTVRPNGGHAPLIIRSSLHLCVRTNAAAGNKERDSIVRRTNHVIGSVVAPCATEFVATWTVQVCGWMCHRGASGRWPSAPRTSSISWIPNEVWVSGHVVMTTEPPNSIGFGSAQIVNWKSNWISYV